MHIGGKQSNLNKKLIKALAIQHTNKKRALLMQLKINN